MTVAMDSLSQIYDQLYQTYDHGNFQAKQFSFDGHSWSITFGTRRMIIESEILVNAVPYGCVRAITVAIFKCIGSELMGTAGSQRSEHDRYSSNQEFSSMPFYMNILGLSP